MIVTISGLPGAGKSTTGRLLAQRLGYEYYSMGDIWGESAKEHGMTLAEYHEHLRMHPGFDKELDDRQRRLGERDAIVMEGRLSFHFIPRSFKVYLSVAPTVGAERVFATERDDERYRTLEECREQLAVRARDESERFRALYGVDPHDTTNFDVVIDTTDEDAETVVGEILVAVQRSLPRGSATRS